ncbi:hypothetical protein NDU88_003322, partial [Pleurodeles waltl]
MPVVSPKLLSGEREVTANSTPALVPCSQLKKSCSETSAVTQVRASPVFLVGCFLCYGKTHSAFLADVTSCAGWQISTLTSHLPSNCGS